ncbi:unnamed protein product [Moneuplotes crassus]|uniref:Uncharacterized protein n=1 Tax=Euplotes crassus TaxID=5936 RepID=A0AAD1UJJ3_EUPCR|nr:unnamed protein product [Moneuplotes crassus]
MRVSKPFFLIFTYLFYSRRRPHPICCPNSPSCTCTCTCPPSPHHLLPPRYTSFLTHSPARPSLHPGRPSSCPCTVRCSFLSPRMLTQ